MRRRTFLSVGAAGVSLGLSGCAGLSRAPSAHVIVVGGGLAGATAVQTLRRWDPRLTITLVERQDRFVSCPMSNLVIAGARSLDDLTLSYDALERRHIRRVQATLEHLDADRRRVHLSTGDTLSYDRLILAPGVDFRFESIEGLAQAHAQGLALHAWKAGPETLQLHQQLRAMPEGGVFALSIPRAPYRCPPGPYERASLVAQFLKAHKPRAKVLILDANPDIVAKKALFLQAWNTLYPGLIEHRPHSEVTAFDAATTRARLSDGTWIQADVWNIIPPHQAAHATRSLRPDAAQWVRVDFRTFESTVAPGVHVIGDATEAAPRMPKSGFMAHNHAKVAADAVLALLTDQPINETPILMNTCYSFVSDQQAMRVSSVHKWSGDQRTLLPVPQAGGTSSRHSPEEGALAWDWAQNLWHDALG